MKPVIIKYVLGMTLLKLKKKKNGKKEGNGEMGGGKEKSLLIVLELYQRNARNLFSC